MADLAPMTEDDVCAHVRDSVLEQRLAPGTKLTEEALCGIFGVGRTTVRRAFLLLKRDNIVELHRNRGAVVASPSPDQARQVFECRRLVETALLEQLTDSIQTSALEALKAHLAKEAAALSAADIARWIRLTGEFHLLLAQLAGNDVMVKFLEQLVFQTSLIVALYGPAGGAPNCSGNDHQHIVSALEEGNFQSARKLLVTHLLEIEEQLDFSGSVINDDLQAAFSKVRSA